MSGISRFASRFALSTALAGALLALPSVVPGAAFYSDGVAYAQGGGSGGGSGGGGGMGAGQDMNHGAQGMGQGAPTDQMEHAQQRERSMHMNRETIRSTQRALNKLGYNAGSGDGIAGPKTHAAVEAYQAHNGMKADGQLTAELANRIQTEARNK